ncbi:MAG: hypothetical protein IH616_19040, partial [Gemmatimonadales bacterium]|nr:hypothetical protein [Gemmatimonadales bacterium]
MRPPPHVLPCLAAALAMALLGCGDLGGRSFAASWNRSPDRRWVGPGFWANRLQDWEVTNGRLRSVHALPLRTVHLLTRRIAANEGTLRIELTMGPSGAAEADSGRT